MYQRAKDKEFLRKLDVLCKGVKDYTEKEKIKKIEEEKKEIRFMKKKITAEAI